MTASMPTTVPTTANLRGDLVDNLSTFVAVGGITIGATTINVDDTTGFPAAGLASIRKQGGGGGVELFSYTGKTGTSFTGVTRNFNSRYASAWAEDDVVELYWVADFHNRHVQETIAIAQKIVTQLGNGSAGITASSGDFTLAYGANPNLYVTSSGGASFRVLASGSTAVYIQTQSNHPIYFTTNNGTNALTIETNKSVTVPVGPLSIGAGGGSGTALTQLVFGFGIGSSAYNIRMKTHHSTTASLNRIEHWVSTASTTEIQVFTLTGDCNALLGPGGSNSTPIGALKFTTDAAAVRWGGIQAVRGSDAANIDLRFFTMAGDGGGVWEALRMTNNRDIAIVSGKKIYLDGVAASGDTYIYESAANNISIYTNGSLAILIDGSQNVCMASTKGLFLDGGFDTYISETAANVIGFTAGGALSAQVKTSGSADATTYNIFSLRGGMGTGGSGQNAMDCFIRTTAAVSTSATIIGTTGYGCGWVMGYDGGTKLFLDYIMDLYSSTPTVVSAKEAGGPAARTYSTSGDQITLAMASGTYRIGYFLMTMPLR